MGRVDQHLRFGTHGLVLTWDVLKNIDMGNPIYIFRKLILIETFSV
jgi:hypothetical protein